MVKKNLMTSSVLKCDKTALMNAMKLLFCMHNLSDVHNSTGIVICLFYSEAFNNEKGYTICLRLYNH